MEADESGIEQCSKANQSNSYQTWVCPQESVPSRKDCRL